MVRIREDCCQGHSLLQIKGHDLALHSFNGVMMVLRYSASRDLIIDAPVYQSLRCDTPI